MKPTTTTAFIGPEKSFYFQGSKTTKDNDVRHYLVSVTKSGNLVAYIWGEDGKPVIDNKLPVVIKRKIVNSIPDAISRLNLNEDFTKLESKEYRTLEVRYLETIRLPSLKDLLKMKLNSLQKENVLELAVAYSKISQRNAAVFGSYIRAFAKAM